MSYDEPREDGMRDTADARDADTRDIPLERTDAEAAGVSEARDLISSALSSQSGQSGQSAEKSWEEAVPPSSDSDEVSGRPGEESPEPAETQTEPAGEAEASEPAGEAGSPQAARVELPLDVAPDLYDPNDPNRPFKREHGAPGGNGSASDEAAKAERAAKRAAVKADRAAKRDAKRAERVKRLEQSRSEKKEHRPLSKQAKVAILACLWAFTIVVLVSGIYSGVNQGKVLHGVSVAGIDVGGMTEEEASEAISTGLGERFATTTITAVPTEEDRARLKAAYDEAGISDYDFTWTVTADMVGVSVDADRLASEAYDVGRSAPGWSLWEDIKSFFGGRWKALFGGVEIDASDAVSYEPELLDAVVITMDARLQVAPTNWDVVTTGTDVRVTEGSDGTSVDEDALADRFTQAFLLDGQVTLGVPMKTDPVTIDQQEAQACADQISQAIQAPAYLSYKGQTWEIPSDQLGMWTYTRVVGEGDDAQLVPYIDGTTAISGLTGIMGDVAFDNAKNATFDVSSGVPVVVPSVTGSGPDLTTGTALLSEMLYGQTADGNMPSSLGGASFDDASRTVTVAEREVVPDITTEQAENMGIHELITSYTLGYGSGGNSNRKHNVELALTMLNGTIVAPGDSWSWVEDMGPCDEDAGFLPAGAIGEGGTSIQEAGGGICNVATGLYNAIYEAGLQIDERHNHSEYLSNYPLGRDCTVSYPGVTFTWTNDYQNYVLITTSYDGTDMTISIWGTDEDRTVTSENSDFDGNSIYNYRKVYDAAGNLIHDDTFYSYFRY